MTKLFLKNLVTEITPMIWNGLSTVKTDLMHHYVIGLVAMPLKSSKYFKKLAHNIIHGNEKQKYNKIK